MSPQSEILQPRHLAEPSGPLRVYLYESRRPLTSLLFVLPMLVAYEVGVLIMPTTMRNGADAWMRRLLDVLGLGGYFLLPCLTVAVLLGWHHLSRQPWRVSHRVLLAMLAESAMLGFLLVGLARLHGVLLSAFLASTPRDWLVATSSHPITDGVGQVIAYCGAGIYEEVLFRLLLVSAAARLAFWAGLRGAALAAAAVVSTSLLFSLAHYVGAAGDAWDLYSFLFRFSAGVFFAVLFVYRGFGVAAGTHALYDVLVGIDWG